ncbi:S-layer protein [Bacteroides sp. 214]|uniref:glycoside hydrolase family 10 protein n=1 Tax=Bacteroides sp. 214 TaxID=2302935 RepID=UPI0013D00293|nr:family 10 glycosylhydrolase [Bacteroides sp. 214]NDW13505.1 S-layer protein [Bacteroides sp. 214]
MHKFFLLFFLSLFSMVMTAQPKYEVRAAWITTAYALDWPKTRATSTAQTKKQQEELLQILDKLQEANFNTVLFQARTRGDVFYKSAIESYSALLTGKVGKTPGYDPLKFVVEECHKRGMECHAWIVGIPLGNNKQVASLGARSVTKKSSGICVRQRGNWYLNPGNPKTKEYLMELANEIVDNYDIDGIHLDYLRYPENMQGFADAKEFKQYGKGKSITQWRRDNITEIVRHIYKGVKAKKPWVKVSTSPVGKFRDTTRYPSKNWNAYHTVHQDVQQWLSEGIQDQIYPMMYFRENDFFPFALDWQEQSNGRHIIPGLGIYFLHPNDGNWSIDDIERQLRFIRKHQLAGKAHYRVEFLINNTQGIYDKLASHYYTTPALQPPMPWLDNVAPTPPTSLTAIRQEGYVTLSWQAATDNDVSNTPYYIIYGSDSFPVDTDSPINIIAQRIKETNYTYAPLLPWKNYAYYAVSAVDRFGNESEATQCICGN